MSSTQCVGVFAVVVVVVVVVFNDAMIAALCSKREQFNESVTKWFRDSDSSMHIFLDLPSQIGVCLNNSRR